MAWVCFSILPLGKKATRSPVGVKERVAVKVSDKLARSLVVSRNTSGSRIVGDGSSAI